LFVPLSGTDITDLEINCVLDVLNSGRLALGPYLDKFETIVKDYVNSTYSVAVNSGTSALHLILRSLGFKSGDKMIVTPFTFISSANVSLFENGKPVFIDIDHKTYNMSTANLKHFVEVEYQGDVSYFMGVDIFGIPLEWDNIYEILPNEIKIIEDSCEALGGEYKNQKLGGKEDIISKRLHEIEESENIDDLYIENKDAFNREECYEIVRRKLSWQYPYKILSSMPAKITVTELKRMTNDFSGNENPGLQPLAPTIIKRPAFLEEVTGLSRAEKGTVLHFVMQHLDFDLIFSVDDISQQINKMVLRELITQQQAETVNPWKILKFVRSSLGIRMKSSQILKREVPFNIEVNGGRIESLIRNFLRIQELPEECDKIMQSETILLQGIIDCYFVENGEIVLIDYKTDFVENHNIEKIKEKYRVQIECYQEALERITGKKVKEKYIYLFSGDKILKY
jgi:hypothetical protein